MVLLIYLFDNISRPEFIINEFTKITNSFDRVDDHYYRAKIFNKFIDTLTKVKILEDYLIEIFKYIDEKLDGYYKIQVFSKLIIDIKDNNSFQRYYQQIKEIIQDVARDFNNTDTDEFKMKALSLLSKTLQNTVLQKHFHL